MNIFASAAQQQSDMALRQSGIFGACRTAPIYARLAAINCGQEQVRHLCLTDNDEEESRR